MSPSFTILTLFPELFREFSNSGVVGRAIQNGILPFHCLNIRDFTEDKYKTVDDRPFGGGDGMVMMAEPVSKAVQGAQKLHVKSKVIFFTPHGVPWTQARAQEWAASNENFILVCGRYGGIDQRWIEREVDLEVSLGDFVLSGGEIAAMAIVDSVGRHIEGVLGNEESSINESFVHGLLEGPQFTRPRDWNGMPVPDILCSGDHQKIAEFRKRTSLLTTLMKRKNLLSESEVAEALALLPWLQTLSSAQIAALGLTELFEGSIDRGSQ